MRGARTPGLAAPVMVVPLTPRERDIATLAAAAVSPARTSPTRLFLSVRTVNNHLQNAYTKLGVGGRRQLAGALGGLTELSADGLLQGPIIIVSAVRL